MKRIISMCLSAVLLLSLCATGAAKTAQAEEKQKVIVIDAGHQTRAMSATEPIGPGSSQRKAKVTGGASGCVTHLPEYKLNLQVAKKLQKELVNRGYKVRGRGAGPGLPAELLPRAHRLPQGRAARHGGRVQRAPEAEPELLRLLPRGGGPAAAGHLLLRGQGHLLHRPRGLRPHAGQAGPQELRDEPRHK